MTASLWKRPSIQTERTGTRVPLTLTAGQVPNVQNKVGRFKAYASKRVNFVKNLVIDIQMNPIKLMSRFNYIVAVFAAFFATSFPFAACAADVYVERYSVNLTGEIRSGDAERIASLVAQKKVVGRLIINSPGGDLVEALRIGDLVNGLHIDVNVAKGGYCISACFFIFLEGYHRHATASNDDGTLRPKEKRDRWAGVVGIHRPYLKSPTGDVAGVKRQEDVMRNVRGYLATKGVPQHLIDEMMARPSNDVYWLRPNDLNLVGEFSPGDEEAVIARCGYKRFDARYAENWSDDREDRLDNCTFDYWEEQYFPSQRQYIAKLRTGWRSWSKK